MNPQIGWFVKISRENENFWLEVLAIEGQIVTGRVDNILADTHELSYNDVVEFEMSEIIDIHPLLH